MGDRVRSIQALRAVAAWMVAIGHLLLSMIGVLDVPDFLDPITDAAARFAHAGVDLFFVISGAIMYMVASRTTGSRFLLRRLTRIYPLFWLALTANIVISRNIPASAMDAASFYSLAAFPEPLMIGWTLAYEIRFYIIVALALWLLPASTVDRRFLLVAGVVLLLVAAGLFGVTPADPVTTPLMLEFLFGVFVAALAKRYTPQRPWWMGMTALVILAGAAIWLYPLGINEMRVYGFGLPSALLLYAAISLERAGKLTIPDWLVSAGDASYSVYVWHIPVILVVLQRWPTGQAWIPIYLLLCVCLIAGVSWASWHLFERRVLRWTRHTMAGNPVRPA